MVMAASIAGCSGSKSAPVHGKVTLKDGTPVKDTTLTFENSERHLKAWGVTGEDGTYTLTTETPGDGAPLGSFKISVHSPLPKDSAQPTMPGPFNPRYESPGTSGLEYTVKPGDNTYDIVLDKR
jgi:hypothetical protein